MGLQSYDLTWQIAAWLFLSNHHHLAAPSDSTPSRYFVPQCLGLAHCSSDVLSCLVVNMSVAGICNIVQVCGATLNQQLLPVIQTNWIPSVRQQCVADTC